MAAATVIVMAVVCALLGGGCVALYVTLKDVNAQLAAALEREANIAQILAETLKPPPVATAQQIVENAKKRMRTFTTHKRWSDERAELEARDDPQRISHEERVREFEQLIPKGVK